MSNSLAIGSIVSVGPNPDSRDAAGRVGFEWLGRVTLVVEDGRSVVVEPLDGDLPYEVPMKQVQVVC